MAMTKNPGNVFFTHEVYIITGLFGISVTPFVSIVVAKPWGQLATYV